MCHSESSGSGRPSISHSSSSPSSHVSLSISKQSESIHIWGHSHLLVTLFFHNPLHKLWCCVLICIQAKKREKRELLDFPLVLLIIPPPCAGTLPGAAEQNAWDQVETSARANHLPLQHWCHVRGLHCQLAQAARQPGPRKSQTGVRPPSHDRPGRGLQKQVRHILDCHDSTDCICPHSTPKVWTLYGLLSVDFCRVKLFLLRPYLNYSNFIFQLKKKKKFILLFIWGKGQLLKFYLKVTYYNILYSLSVLPPSGEK